MELRSTGAIGRSSAGIAIGLTPSRSRKATRRWFSVSNAGAKRVKVVVAVWVEVGTQLSGKRRRSLVSSTSCVHAKEYAL
jgi:hypothetical protein